MLFIFLYSLMFSQSYRERGTTLTCVDRTFSVHAHLVTDSLGSTGITSQVIQDALNFTNSLFEPICIQFELCDLDVLPNYRFDTLSRQEEFPELLSKYNDEFRINIFFVSLIRDQFIPDQWGFTTRNGINLYENGGIAIVKNDIFRALPHEMGHFFGLFNTYEGGDELVNGSNCLTAGDRICDTPADPYVQGTSADSYLNDNCVFISELVDRNNDDYLPDVCNVMSYYEGCGIFFSSEQLETMAQNYLNGPKLMW